MDPSNTGHLARWARFHTGFWHAYPPDDSGRRHIRSVCGFATSTVDSLEAAPGGTERWHCRQCRLVVGTLIGTDEPQLAADAEGSAEPDSPPS